MQLSVLIPTFQRPARLGACVAALRRQSLGASEFEVLIGVDGGDGGVSEQAAREAWGDSPGALRVMEFAKCGPGAVRNRLGAKARGAVLLLLNDDVIPDAESLARHVSAQREQLDHGREAMVLGDAPWRVHDDDSLFDRMVRETSMVFFYDQMIGRGEGHDWGCRHAWTINLSMPAAVLSRVGFREIDGTYGYDDIELAWRARVPVLYRPGASALHDHRISPREYLRRERALGRSAVAYARLSPEFAQDVFRRDLLDPACTAPERRLSPEQVRSEMEWFERLGRVSPHADRHSVRDAFRRHLLLKRFAWAQGVLEALGCAKAGAEPALQV